MNMQIFFAKAVLSSILMIVAIALVMFAGAIFDGEWSIAAHRSLDALLAIVAQLFLLKAMLFDKTHIYLKRSALLFYWSFELLWRLVSGGISRISPMAGGLMFIFAAFTISAELSVLWFFAGEHLWHHTAVWITNPLAATASVVAYGLATAFTIWGGNPAWR